MQKILVSACLLGENVRYNACITDFSHPILQQWQAEGRVVSCCPEMAGGLPVPRAAAEIQGEGGGEGVLAGNARVQDAVGNDLSAPFIAGAQKASALAQAHGIRHALLKQGSPSCGSERIYDGHFCGKRIAGAGVCSAALRRSGIAVWGEESIEALQATLQASECDN